MFACAGAQADDYRFELGASFDRALFDGDISDDDADIFSIGGTFYLKPVPTDGVPLAEAAFLHRSSFVAAQIARVDVGGENFDLLGANFGYYIPNTIFFGRIGVTKADIGEDDDTNVNGTFGVMPIDGLLVTTDFDEDGWDPNATARYVGKLGNDHYYAASISVVDPDEGDLDIGLSLTTSWTTPSAWAVATVRVPIRSAFAPRSSSCRISPSAGGSTPKTTVTASAPASTGASDPTNGA